MQSNIQPEHIAAILGPILAGLTGGVSVLTTAEVIRTSRILTRKRDKKRKKSFYLALFASGTIASFTGLQFYARSYFGHGDRHPLEIFLFALLIYSIYRAKSTKSFIYHVFSGIILGALGFAWAGSATISATIMVALFAEIFFLAKNTKSGNIIGKNRNTATGDHRDNNNTNKSKNSRVAFSYADNLQSSNSSNKSPSNTKFVNTGNPRNLSSGILIMSYISVRIYTFLISAFSGLSLKDVIEEKFILVLILGVIISLLFILSSSLKKIFLSPLSLATSFKKRYLTGKNKPRKLDFLVSIKQQFRSRFATRRFFPKNNPREKIAIVFILAVAAFLTAFIYGQSLQHEFLGDVNFFREGFFSRELSTAVSEMRPMLEVYYKAFLPKSFTVRTIVQCIIFFVG